MKEKLRMCLACKNMFDKKDLVRIVKNKEGQVFIDSTGKQNGRGAYVCKNAECLQKLQKQKLLNKTFKTNIDEAIYKNLEEDFANR